MEITGKVKQLMPMQTGTGKNGEWFKQEMLIETEGNYPKSVMLTAWKDLAKFAATLRPGSKVTAQFDLESREYNGRYYTEVKAYKLDVGATQPTQTSAHTTASVDQDDLPF